MKRWPLIASFILFIALCVSVAYWALQLMRPPLRTVAAPPPPPSYIPNLSAASALFGGQAKAAVATNYQLKGVIVSSHPAESVAILSASDGKPAQALRPGEEFRPGVKVKEVQRNHVLLVENGVEKRVELPLEASPQSAGLAPPRNMPQAMQSRPSPAMPTTVVNGMPGAAPQPPQVQVQPAQPQPPQPQAATQPPPQPQPQPPQAPAAQPGQPGAQN